MPIWEILKNYLLSSIYNPIVLKNFLHYKFAIDHFLWFHLWFLQKTFYKENISLCQMTLCKLDMDLSTHFQAVIIIIYKMKQSLIVCTYVHTLGQISLLQGISKVLQWLPRRQNCGRVRGGATYLYIAYNFVIILDFKYAVDFKYADL